MDVIIINKEVIHLQVPLQIPCDDLTYLVYPKFSFEKFHHK